MLDGGCGADKCATCLYAAMDVSTLLTSLQLLLIDTVQRFLAWTGDWQDVKEACEVPEPIRSSQELSSMHARF